MSILKRRLNRAVKIGDALLPEEKTPKPDYEALQALRHKIKQHLGLPVTQFCRVKPPFDPKHGLVYKILRTDPQRLKDSTLCSHDMAFWLRNYKHPSAALWVVKLAGPSHGAVSRNQLLQWLRTHDNTDIMQTVYKWTKKWGFKDTERTRSIVAKPASVSEAREMYRSADMNSARSKHVFGNKLLSEVAVLDTADPAEIWAFFRTLNKDVVTFQIMLGAMIKNNELRKFLPEIWELAERQARANNISIDDKLRETYARVKALTAHSTVRSDTSSRRIHSETSTSTEKALH